LPSLVLNVFADQGFWGWRLRQLGVGDCFPFRKLSAKRLAVALRGILTEPVRRRARELGMQLHQERGEQVAADLIERWMDDDMRGPALG